MRRFYATIFFTLAAGCGAASEDRRTPPPPGVQTPAADDASAIPEQAQPAAAATGGILRGQWLLPISSGDVGAGMALAQSVNQAISGQVAASVTFTVANTNFSAPTAPTGPASYGSLDVTALKDNNLRICGAAGNTRCTKALIRIYTTGTAAKGLYSAVESAGLPITTSAGEIGLNAAGAVAVAAISVPSTGVLKLSDFTAAARLPIPISVDFTDAAAGTYASTLVVEYLLQ